MFMAAGNTGLRNVLCVCSAGGWGVGGGDTTLAAVTARVSVRMTLNVKQCVRSGKGYQKVTIDMHILK